ncbi:MAG: mechanosensitive ion channel family protein [Oscillospiraceae bacterium]|jgi:small-conductance mechanosensitive channel|nr:mechanosensitive ion channel family protein [Oscillospiraceae bacterium]
MNLLLNLLGIESDSGYAAAVRVGVTLIVAVLLILLINAVTRKLVRRRIVTRRNINVVQLIRYTLTAAVGVWGVLSMISGNAQDALNKTLAGSGIIAVILSIACQEPIGNLASGVILMLTHAFRVGDLIRFIDHDINGFVEETNLRHTIIRTFENRLVVIPNSLLNRGLIENWSNREVRVNLPILLSVTYESDVHRAMEIIRTAIVSHPGYTSKSGESPNAMVKDFTDSAILLRARIYGDDATALYNVKSELLLEIKRGFAEADVRFAYPHVHVVTDKPERSDYEI